jgi:hypothetical protein
MMLSRKHPISERISENPLAPRLISHPDIEQNGPVRGDYDGLERKFFVAEKPSLETRFRLWRRMNSGLRGGTESRDARKRKDFWKKVGERR